MLISTLKEGIKSLGVLETSRRTGISRSILNNFANHGASIKAENLEKIMEALEISILPKHDFSLLSKIPCDPNKRMDILKLTKILKDVYQTDKVILFGSQARGDWTKRSDIDFLVVRNKDLSNVDVGGERIISFEQRVLSPYDVVTVSEKNLKESLKDKSSVIYQAWREGVKLYEDRS